MAVMYSLFRNRYITEYTVHIRLAYVE